MLKFELLTGVVHAIETLWNDDTRKHLVEASEHIETAAGEIVDATMLVLEIIQNLKSGNKSRDILTAEVLGMLPEGTKAKYDKR